MQRSRSMSIAGVAVLALVVGGAATRFWPGQSQVDFTHDVRPIFNGKCITCHGGVRQNGGFSVLFREDALG